MDRTRSLLAELFLDNRLGPAKVNRVKSCAVQILLLAAFVARASDAPVAERIAQRDFPSVFQAWNGATPLPNVDKISMMARHDLVFIHPSMIGLRSESAFEGTAFAFTPASLAAAKVQRATLLAKNPKLVLLAEVRYRDAPKGFVPEDSAWWKRDAGGKFNMGWAEGGYRLLDVAQTDWQAQVANRARAVMATGIFDGVMLDWWSDDGPHLNLIRHVRDAIGPDALILVNANDRKIPNTAPYVNGLFMECYRNATPEDWQRISETLRWAEANLRRPHINCVETWYHHSRQDLNLMRAVTTLTLTQSDGYCLFSDPDELPTPDHLHDWYDFWDKRLGQPKQPGFQRPDGAWERAFSGGNVIYNPSGNSNVTVHFDMPQRSRTTDRLGFEHAVPSNDGDIFLHN